MVDVLLNDSVVVGSDLSTDGMSGASIGATVGAVVGVLLACSLLVGAILITRRRRRKQPQGETKSIIHTYPSLATSPTMAMPGDEQPRSPMLSSSPRARRSLRFEVSVENVASSPPNDAGMEAQTQEEAIASLRRIFGGIVENQNDNQLRI